jgi:hypothetical protein
MLDNTMILYGSGMSDSNMHTPENVPSLVVAGKGYAIRGNRYLKYPEGTPLANLQLTLLDKIGLRTDHFGDSTGELSALVGV